METRQRTSVTQIMLQAYRARIFHFLDDPSVLGKSAWQYFEDGVLLIEDGRIREVGAAKELMPQLNIPVQHFPDRLIVPGFVDTHIHYPQMEMIAAYGDQLLSWLQNHTFPTEAKFADEEYAAGVASSFMDELLRNGTTTALVFGTVHPVSVDVLFREAQRRGARMIAGKVLMDRHAPAELLDTPQQGYVDSRKLIEKWHGVDRLQYAVTPRFAPTSTDAQLQRAGDLLQEYPGVYLHTHLAENADEVEWVKQLFPAAQNYLDVYDQAGLLGRRSVFAHGVHLCDQECMRLKQTDSVIAHCPTSNLFLGSGLFNLEKVQQHQVRVGLGTDVGAGTSFSLFRTMGEAYKIQQLRNCKLDPFYALYLATLGGAKALDLDRHIGNFSRGKEADFIVLGVQATPLLDFRLRHLLDRLKLAEQQEVALRDLFFVLQTLADDRVVEGTYLMGKRAYRRGGV